MYNLLIASEENAWEKGFFEFDTSRFLEYTNNEIVAQFSPISLNKSILQRIPALFAYEGYMKPYRAGIIRKIQNRDKSIFINYEIFDDIEPIPIEVINELEVPLDIRKFERNRTHWAVKDGDLIEILKKKNILLSDFHFENEIIERTQLKKEKISRLTSITSFMTKVFEKQNLKNCEVFYRGHSNRNKYKLEPSLFRRDNKGNYLYLQSEDLMYKELIVSNSADFEGDSCTLDKLVRMQHYSLPTRLLDITSNPLIALYFACISNADVEGEVITFQIEKDLMKYFDSDTASCIANLARLSFKEKNKISLEKNSSDQNEAIEKLIYLIKEEKPYFVSKIDIEDLKKVICVKSKMNNSRILSQSGAFLLFGQDAIMDEKGSEGISIERLIIADKERILSQLDALNINERTVFPYIENSAKYVKNKFKEKV